VAGWTPELADRHRQAFLRHLDYTFCKSKDYGYISLGKNLLNSQKMVIDTVFTGLGEDKHDFKFLKSRQLGISTITRAISLYWNGIFEMTSALLFDTTQHLDEARLELIDMLQKFPPEYEFPRKVRDNRYSLTLAGGSRINLMSAGVGKTKSSGGLGSGSGISMVHRSELCGYGDPEALENFRHTLSRLNPNRLFIDESTARGYGIWHDIWNEGKEDPDCVCVFIGWWAHQNQVIERDHPDFKTYTADPLTDDERNKIRLVKEQYNHEITAEQLAWIRKEMRGTDDDENKSDDPTRIQNQPWTEAEAFQQTGATFFQSEILTEQTNKNANNKFTAYSFMPGFDFADMTVVATKHWRHGQLKVWEEPVEDSVYVVSCDPAYGHSDKSDRSAIQVLRCFSDGLDQVAEYAWPLINTQQLAWVVAAIEGWYAGQTSTVYRIVEINGPGEATWRELQQLKQKIATGYFGHQLTDRGLLSIQANVKNYFYTRSDSQHPGHVWQFKTQSQLKVAIMERLRDVTSSGLLRIRSMATLEEMRAIAREGDSIAAEGSGKDDRVVSLAMGVRCWEERARRNLMQIRRTREADIARRRVSMVDQIKLYNDNQLSTFLAGKSAARLAQQRAALRQRRWGGR
jgi:hypothetical protein